MAGPEAPLPPEALRTTGPIHRLHGSPGPSLAPGSWSVSTGTHPALQTFRPSRLRRTLGPEAVWSCRQVAFCKLNAWTALRSPVALRDRIVVSTLHCEWTSLVPRALLEACGAQETRLLLKRAHRAGRMASEYWTHPCFPRPYWVPSILPTPSDFTSPQSQVVGTVPFPFSRMRKKEPRKVL